MLLERRQPVARRIEVAELERPPHARDLREDLRLFLDGGTELHVQIGRRGTVHARDLHVAAERDRADSVFDSLAAHLHERRWEAEIEPPRAHADQAGDEEVPGLVGVGRLRPQGVIFRKRPRASVRLDELRQLPSRGAVDLRERLLDDVCDREKRQPSREKRGDGHFVRRVVRARVRSSALAGLAREPQQRECLEIRWMELERQARREIEWWDRCRLTPRVRERVGDRDAHVRVAEVRERPSVAEPYERVDDRRRLHGDVDPFVRKPEQEVRLDQFEALVRKCRGVDGDLRPHRPGRMGQRVRRGDVREVVTRSAAERPARRGQHERHDLVVAPTFKALERCRMFAVHGDQRPSTPLLRGERQLARSDQALLVGKRERDAALERPERRGKSGESDDRVQDEIRLGPLEQLGRIAADLRQRREPLDRLRPGHRRDQLEVVVRVDHLDRLPADRARSSEECDPLHDPSVGSAGRGQVAPKARRT